MTNMKKKIVKQAELQTVPNVEAMIGLAAKDAGSAINYNAVVSSAELAVVLLTALDFKIDPVPDPYVSRDLHYGGEVAVVTFDPSAGTATGMFHWWVEARYGALVALRCAAKYMVHYTGLANQDEDAAKAFVARVGRFASYPYFRALASQMSWESGANLPPMPVLR